MNVITQIGSTVISKPNINQDSFISLRELDSVYLKVNYISLYLKTRIHDLNSELDLLSINNAINNIDLSIFVKGICDGNNQVIILLSKNVIYELSKFGIIVPYASIYDMLS